MLRIRPAAFQILGLLALFFVALPGRAQFGTDRTPGAPVTLQNAPQRDTSDRTNSSTWRDEDTRIYYERIGSKAKLHPDTALRNFHRRPYLHSWYRDLGNPGSPARNLLFTPEARTGPTLGYRTFDIYRFHPDSLKYYNTTRPYSEFVYNLGSKAEQIAGILHTQNIRPNWNFAAHYTKISAPGYYRIQRVSHDLASFSMNYNSLNQRYKLYGAIVYNKLQHDENGGIVSDSLLKNENFDDRRTIPVRFQNDGYSALRSSVTNVLRDFSISLNHAYTWGRIDTLYNEDSTRYSFNLIPRFSIAHRLRIHSEKYQFKDIRPDSLRYTGFFEESFAVVSDSVFSQQKWIYADNAFLLNGFIGQGDNQLLFSAGFGSRVDQFNTEYIYNNESDDFFSNYLTGELQKEALQDRQWSYTARARLFLTGRTAGDLLLAGHISKDFGRSLGTITAGAEQRLNTAPYNYTLYKNQHYEQRHSYNKETVTQIYGSYHNSRLQFSGGIKSYLIANYFYLNTAQEFSQYADPFNILQLWAGKVFRLGIFVLDNELVYQQKTGNGPINIPAVMGRHQLSIETGLFGRALKIATGLDVRWHTSYAPSGYSPFFNRFYYQDAYTVSNAPEMAAFFNFKIKKFRCFVMGDQLQQILFPDNVISSQGYPLQDAMIRFGFNWVMIN